MGRRWRLYYELERSAELYRVYTRDPPPPLSLYLSFSLFLSLSGAHAQLWGPTGMTLIGRQQQRRRGYKDKY